MVLGVDGLSWGPGLSGRKLFHWVMRGTSRWQPFSLSSYKVSSFVPHGLFPLLFCLSMDPNMTGPAHSWLKLLRPWEKKPKNQKTTSLHLNWTPLALFHSYTTINTTHIKDCLSVLYSKYNTKFLLWTSFKHVHFNDILKLSVMFRKSLLPFF